MLTSRIFILIITLSFPSFVFCQLKVINGQIIIDDKEESYAGSVYIKNIQTSTETYSNSNGEFKIEANIGDSIIFSSSFHKTRVIKINESIYNEGTLTIHLNIDAITLKQANVGNKLTGYLEKDALALKFIDSTSIIYNNLGIKPRDSSIPNREVINKFSPLMFIGNPIEFIGHVSGYYRKKKNLFEYEDKENIIQKIISLWGNEYFVEELKIPLVKIHEFVVMVYNSTSLPQKFKAQHYLEVENLFTEQSKIYLERLNAADNNK